MGLLALLRGEHRRATQGFEKPHGYVFEVPRANRAVEPVPIKAMGRMEHEAAAVDPRSGRLPDRGQRRSRRRLLPLPAERPPAACKGRRAADARGRGALPLRHAHGQTVGKKLALRMGDDRQSRPAGGGDRTGDGVAQGRLKGAAQFIGVEGCHWSKGRSTSSPPKAGTKKGPDLALHPARPEARHAGPALRVEERRWWNEPDTITVPARRRPGLRGRQRRGRSGRRQLPRILSPAGELETFARNDTPLDLHRWEENKPGVMGRSEYSGST